jgi:prevent-host-death family protein
MKDNMEIINTRTAKEHLSHYLNNLEESEPVIITSRGVPRALLISFPESDLASVVIQRSEAVRRIIMEGLSDVKHGETYPVKDARKMANRLRKPDAA